MAGGAAGAHTGVLGSGDAEAEVEEAGRRCGCGAGVWRLHGLWGPSWRPTSLVGELTVQVPQETWIQNENPRNS